MPALRKDVADALLSFIGKLEYLPEREQLQIVKTINEYTGKQAYTLDRAWNRRGTKNNG